MAPRTPAQQKAYNEKRRAETAAKKVKSANVGVAHVPAPKRKTVVARTKPRNTSRAMREAKAKRVAKVKAALPVEARVNAKLKETAKALKARKVGPEPPTHDIAAQIKTLGADSLLPPPKIEATEGRAVAHTMARSYLRGGAPGLGKLRGKTYQASVSFTAPQMQQVVAAAGFRGVSLAEMIRACVVEHLNKG